ncbi:MAG TPA: glycerate kinase [Candidatus Limnocylindrales bacterium]|nr:glycerate kinase [Candidatus Limnocylindrales bacterium]
MNRANRELTILFAPDSFKGSLTSVDVARALAEGWSRARPSDRLELAPLADGGEGTLEAIAAAGGWKWQTAEVADPLGRRIRARWLRSIDGAAAVLEMAEASGLSRLHPNERDAMNATSLGTGQLVCAAVAAGIRHMMLGIGGSATTDGGSGLVEALGARFSDDGDVDLSGLDRRLVSIALEVASDVTNPLLGPEGAAAVYGPQKGATPDVVELLNQRLREWAEAFERATGRGERDTPGAGAAGGVGFALLCLQDRFGSFGLRPGVDLVMEATGFDAKLADADLVITGEGRIDAQTAFGKTSLGVARRAREAGKPCIAVGGGVEPEGIEALALFGAVVVPVVERPQSIEEAMSAGSEPLVRCGARLAGLASLTKSRD